MPTILFENANAALDAAYILQGEYDGFNGVEVEQLDRAAIEFVANQVQSTITILGADRPLSRIPEELINIYSKYKYAQKYDSASSKIIFTVSKVLKFIDDD